ncbi:MAG TPA: hypothetical protein DD725_08275 [Deltaproteobacteria bacterium]|nr:hypothetical protein [Deltaproteobacteria bacterium]
MKDVYKKYLLVRNAVVMNCGMLKTICLILLILHLLAIASYGYNILNKQAECVGSLSLMTLKYWWFEFHLLPLFEPKTVNLAVCNASSEVTLEQFNLFYTQDLWPYINLRLQKIMTFIKWSFMIWLLFPAALLYFAVKSKELKDKIHIRGPQLISIKELHKKIKRKFGKDVQLPLCTFKRGHRSSVLQMPVSFENRMTGVIGGGGTGKTSNSLSPITERLLERQAKEKSCVIIYAYKEYLSEFYDPSRGHILLNPLDKRSVENKATCWTLFNDIRSVLDIDANASSIIPLSRDEKSKFWDTASRQVLSGGLHGAVKHGLRSNKKLWDIFTAPTEELVKFLKDVPEARLALKHLHDPKSSRLANDVMAVLASYIMCFQYMAKADGDFSINKFINEGGVLFINGNEAVQDTLRPYLSTVIDSLARTVLSLPTDTKRRIYFVLDEFQTLNPLPSIIKLLNARSVGFSAFLGFHSKGQLNSLYGENGANEIINFLNTKIIYRMNEVESAKYFSGIIGEREVQRLNESQGGGINNLSDRFTLTQQIEKETLIMPSELTHMPDYDCVIQLPGFDPCKVEHKNFKEYPRRNAHFVLRDDLALESIKQETASVKILKKEIINEYELPELKQDSLPLLIDPDREMDI